MNTYKQGDRVRTTRRCEDEGMPVGTPGTVLGESIMLPGCYSVSYDGFGTYDTSPLYIEPLTTGDELSATGRATLQAYWEKVQQWNGVRK